MQMSRYDEHAAWFVSYSQHWTPTSSHHLPAHLDGAHVLDLACGWGPLSRILAERGADVTGVELSKPLLDQAQGARPRETRAHGDPPARSATLGSR